MFLLDIDKPMHRDDALLVFTLLREHTQGALDYGFKVMSICLIGKNPPFFPNPLTTRTIVKGKLVEVDTKQINDWAKKTIETFSTEKEIVKGGAK